MNRSIMPDWYPENAAKVEMPDEIRRKIGNEVIVEIIRKGYNKFDTCDLHGNFSRVSRRIFNTELVNENTLRT